MFFTGLYLIAWAQRIIIIDPKLKPAAKLKNAWSDLLRVLVSPTKGVTTQISKVRDERNR